jgi:hypothetical protein
MKPFELELLHYVLIPTTKRLTFDIIWQDPMTIWEGDDDGDYHTFKATNGYEVISRSVMDIQSERIWLWGGSTEERAVRSGSMVFGDNFKRDKAFDNFQKALQEWNDDWMARYYANQSRYNALNALLIT